MELADDQVSLGLQHADGVATCVAQHLDGSLAGGPVQHFGDDGLGAFLVVAPSEQDVDLGVEVAEERADRDVSGGGDVLAGLYRLGRRLAPLTGAAFFVLMVVALIIERSPPAATDSTEDVVGWWTENDSRSLTAAQLGGLASALLVCFGGSVRAALRRTEGEPGPVAAIAFSGFLIAGVGLASIFGFVSAAAETAGDVPAAVTHTLSVLSELFFIPVAMGLLVALVATSVIILRQRGPLPRWLGLVTILIAIGFLTPASLGAAIAAAIWILYISVLLFMRQQPATPRQTGPTE